VQEGTAYAAVFMNVLRSVSKDETTQYVLALLDQALAGACMPRRCRAAQPRRRAGLTRGRVAAAVDKDRIRLFHGPHMGTPGPFVVMLRLLERSDWFIQDRASRLLCKLLVSCPEHGRSLGLAPAASGDAPAAPATPPVPGSASATCLSFLDWSVRTLRSPGDQRAVAAATGALACLMSWRELRPIAFRHGVLGLLAPTLRAASAGPHNVQLLYEAALATWLLTFYAPAAEGTLVSGALAGLIETARSATKEKVVRVALAALHNLLECEGAPGARVAVQAASGRLAAALRLRAFHDEEVLEALTALETHAAASTKAAGSFERYRQEVLTGALDWGLGRGDESFWREHAAQFEENNYALVRTLCGVLASSSAPPKALAVACHDVGQIAAAVPRGRTVVGDCGGKAAVMKLMTHEDEDVRKQALIATQKLLLHGWQFLEGSK
jgi:V-type H+-transporting ATPase subunit H